MMEIAPSLGEHQGKVSCWMFSARLFRRYSMRAPHSLLWTHRALLPPPLIWWVCGGSEVTTRQQSSPAVSVVAAVLFVLARQCFLSGSAEMGKFPGGRCCLQGILHWWEALAPVPSWAAQLGLCRASRMSPQALPPLWWQPLFKGFPQQQILVEP